MESIHNFLVGICVSSISSNKRPSAGTLGNACKVRSHVFERTSKSQYAFKNFQNTSPGNISKVLVLSSSFKVIIQ